MPCILLQQTNKPITRFYAKLVYMVTVSSVTKCHFDMFTMTYGVNLTFYCLSSPIKLYYLLYHFTIRSH